MSNNKIVKIKQECEYCKSRDFLNIICHADLFLIRNEKFKDGKLEGLKLAHDLLEECKREGVDMYYVRLEEVRQAIQKEYKERSKNETSNR